MYYEVDTGLMKDWTLIQIEGEAAEAQVDQSLTQSKEKDKKTKVPDQPLDNRPRIVEHKLTSDQADLTIKITEEIACSF